MSRRRKSRRIETLGLLNSRDDEFYYKLRGASSRPPRAIRQSDGNGRTLSFLPRLPDRFITREVEDRERGGEHVADDAP